MNTCNSTIHEVEKVEKAIMELTDIKSLVYEVGKSIVVNHHEIYNEIKTSIKDYDNNEWEDFGK